MTLDYGIGLAIVVALMFYLIAVLVKPEDYT